MQKPKNPLVAYFCRRKYFIIAGEWSFKERKVFEISQQQDYTRRYFDETKWRKENFDGIMRTYIEKLCQFLFLMPSGLAPNSHFFWTHRERCGDDWLWRDWADVDVAWLPLQQSNQQATSNKQEIYVVQIYAENSSHTSRNFPPQRASEEKLLPSFAYFRVISCSSIITTNYILMAVIEKEIFMAITFHWNCYQKHSTSE